MTDRRPDLRTVLRNSGYRRLFAAQTISRWGDTMNTVALVVLVFQLTGSGLGVSGVVIAEILPVLLLAPIAGAVVDRLPRVRVMVGADLARMALAGVLPLVDQHIVAVFAIAFGMSAGSVFFNPASASALPSIVTEDELVAANSGLWSAAVVSQIALAPLAGVLVAAWGPAPAFWFNAATFAGSALALTRLRLPHPPAPVSSSTWTVRVLEGPRLLIRDRLLRLLASVQLLAALSAGATSALLVVLAELHLGAGPGGFGLLLGAIGVGAAFGPFLLTRLTSNPRQPTLLFGPYLLRGLVDLILAATRNLPTAMGALALYGVGTSTGMVTYNSLLQAEVAEHQRGRVFAGFDMLWQSGRLASIALGGLAADAFGIQAVYILGGILLLIAGTIGLTGYKAIQTRRDSDKYD
ncbi:MFS transporter [Kibdelosporangium persicum]|uniref:Transmembrane secretion effector n=1 Tax=Kibdelosporangium persicum TaxID=2698649 RepID=A0ABX2F3D0_9PSEU|nr:MFS transporter [Kibdelosporangium persicum]NRN65752.1 Transmembrane secretion effector [Kibdelosporangium persicum]